MNLAATAARLPLRLGGLDVTERVYLGGGLRVALAEDRTVPLLHCQWILPSGARQDPTGLEGLNALALPLFTGAPDAQAGCMPGLFESLGADLLHHTGWDYATVAIELAADDWRAAVDWGQSLFSQLPSSPAALTAERSRRIVHHRLVARSPAAQADRWWRRVAYPRSRFGYPVDGTEASLARIEHRHVEALHDDLCRFPLWFIAVGCIPRKQLLARLAESARPTLSEAPALPPPELPAEAPGGTYLLAMPTSAQAEIRVGLASVCRTHAAFAGLQLLTDLLGARVARYLRDCSGTSYRSSVQLVPGTGSSPLIIAAAVEAARAGETLERIAIEIERLREEPVPEAELEAAQEVFEIDFLRSLQSLPGLAAKLKRLAINEHPPDYYQNHLDDVRMASASELQALARRHLHRERLFEIVVGPPVSLSPWRTAVISLEGADADMESSKGEYR